MSDYESIHGTRVKYLSSDPTLNSSTEGQVWYNSNSGTNKSLVQIKSTSSGGNLNTARFGGGAGVSGAQASGLFLVVQQTLLVPQRQMQLKNIVVLLGQQKII